MIGINDRGLRLLRRCEGWATDEQARSDLDALDWAIERDYVEWDPIVSRWILSDDGGDYLARTRERYNENAKRWQRSAR